MRESAHTSTLPSISSPLASQCYALVFNHMQTPTPSALKTHSPTSRAKLLKPHPFWALGSQTSTRPQVVQLLLGAGADKTLENGDGNTPAMLARDEDVVRLFG